MGYLKAYTIIGMKIDHSALTDFDGNPIYTEFEGYELGKLGVYDIIEQHEGTGEEVFIAHSYRSVDENNAEPVKWVTSGPGSTLSMRDIELEMRANLPHDIGFDGEFGLWTVIAYR